MRIIYIYIYIDVHWGFLKWRIPKTIDFNTQVVIHDDWIICWYHPKDGMTHHHFSVIYLPSDIRLHEILQKILKKDG